MPVPEPSRTWTRKDAEAVLDDIDAMLADVKEIVEGRSTAQDNMEDLRIVHGPRVEEPGHDAHGDFKEHVHAFQDAQNRLRQIIEAFFEQGIEIADPVEGRVDFISRHGTELSFLCYQSGEEDITHWHDLGETCEDRRPIPGSVDI